jgi:hypothetical protein
MRRTASWEHATRPTTLTNPRVVDECRHGTEAIVDRLEEAPHRITIRDVGLYRQRLAARLLDAGHHALGGLPTRAVIHADAISVCAQQARDRRADAPAGAGDDGYL